MLLGAISANRRLAVMRLRIKLPRKRTLLTTAGCLLIGISVFALFEALTVFCVMESLELKAHDLWVRSQPRDQRMTDKIAVVVIKEDEVRALNEEYPLRDKALLKLLSKLQESKPAAMAVDLFRDRELGPLLPSDRERAAEELE